VPLCNGIIIPSYSAIAFAFKKEFIFLLLTPPKRWKKGYFFLRLYSKKISFLELATQPEGGRLMTHFYVHFKNDLDDKLLDNDRYYVVAAQP